MFLIISGSTALTYGNLLISKSVHHSVYFLFCFVFSLRHRWIFIEITAQWKCEADAHTDQESSMNIWVMCWMCFSKTLEVFSWPESFLPYCSASTSSDGHVPQTVQHLKVPCDTHFQIFIFCSGAALADLFSFFFFLNPIYLQNMGPFNNI